MSRRDSKRKRGELEPIDLDLRDRMAHGGLGVLLGEAFALAVLVLVLVQVAERELLGRDLSGTVYVFSVVAILTLGVDFGRRFRGLLSVTAAPRALTWEDELRGLVHLSEAETDDRIRAEGRVELEFPTGRFRATVTQPPEVGPGERAAMVVVPVLGDEWPPVRSGQVLRLRSGDLTGTFIVHPFARERIRPRRRSGS